MFYLNLWKVIFKKHFIGKIFLFILFIGFIPTISSLGLIETETSKNPYFHVLFEQSEDESFIQQKISDIPGIVTVSRISPDSIKQQLKMSLDQEGESIFNELDFDYTGLTVSISNGLKGKAKDLLKKYIKKVAGNDVELSRVFYPKTKVKNEIEFLSNIKVQFAFLILLWVFIAHIFSKQERNFLYLSRQFNRANSIVTKTYLFNFFSLFVLFVPAFLFIKGTAQVRDLVSFLTICLIVGYLPYLQKFKWQS